MEGQDYLIDTNVVIYYLGLALSKESEKRIDRILSGNYYISVINQIELLGFSKLTKQETIVLESFVAGSTVLDLDEKVIRKTIQIRKTHSIKLPDAIIAATCLVHNCALITHNIKDFEKIEGLDLITA
ncbi:type II toxin-antitoxin system VapC family toxin [Sunxiuqinia dokdonensis]|jgi:predicted nucleic acid-binding protein|uniref:PIN domain-containing protein n=1 Tax=Sunxiuqinia dokdonensis TaxID=1409788 RepID=A0A0L8VAX9_9BACT|nr:type II toxin-antitoxin system VapC family toxin [Sunxiuqinia dokdonensis]KOH45513.1 hypothetical protein NC99_16690 [Sunxiuqinia dokdonensis]